MKNYCVRKCNNSCVEFIYDAEDDEKVRPYMWWSQKKGVFAHINGKTVSLSKYLLGIDEKQTKVLHRNKDSNDFRKSNLFYKNIYTLIDDNAYNVECFDGRSFTISKESYDLVKQYVWHIEGNNYAITKLPSGRIIKLHRLLLGVVDDPTTEVDHINRDTLDNRLSNLRLADRSLNCYNRNVSKYNTSGKVGVYKMSGYDDKWCVQINNKGKRHYLGSYNSYDEAVRVRQEAEARYYS